MLVPLQTLEGWPDSPVPTVVQQLGLLLGIPLVATLAIVVYVVLTQKRERRLVGRSAVIEPLWLGGGQTMGPMLESGVEPATSNKSAAMRAAHGATAYDPNRPMPVGAKANAGGSSDSGATELGRADAGPADTGRHKAGRVDTTSGPESTGGASARW